MHTGTGWLHEQQQEQGRAYTVRHWAHNTSEAHQIDNSRSHNTWHGPLDRVSYTQKQQQRRQQGCHSQLHQVAAMWIA
jgi:hypothetical protein